MTTEEKPEPTTLAEVFEGIRGRGERKSLTKAERKAMRDAAMAARDLVVAHTYLPYDAKVAMHICDLIIEGHTMRSIETQPGMPTAKTIMRWLAAHEDFLAAYQRAKEIQTESMEEEIVEISDDSSKDVIEKIGKDGKPYTVIDHEVVNRSRLRVDTRKWIMSKRAPKRFGDNQNVEFGGQIRATLVIEK